MQTFSGEETSVLLKKLKEVKNGMVPFILSCNIFQNLCPDVELLRSLYETLTAIGDQLKKEAILKDI